MLDYDFEVVQNEESAVPPEDGVHVLGMNLEGARWNPTIFSLDESFPKILYSKVPMFWFKPSLKEDFIKIQTYDCPCYKTSVR